MGKISSTLGTMFGKENKWWEEEKKREAERQRQITQGPAYTKPHNPNDAYKESQENVKNAIKSVSEGPGNNTNVTTNQATPYVIKNRQLGSYEFITEAEAFARDRWINSASKRALFRKLPAAEQARIMESQNPDNELNNLYQQNHAQK